MLKVCNVTGFHKLLFNIKLKLSVFLRFLPEIFHGTISIKRFFLFLRRLLTFLSKMQHNKFVKIGKRTRIDLYVPGFPSRAFFTACKKFMQFEEQMPCATALISVTSACRYKCSYCYQRFDKGKDVNIDSLVSIVKKLQDKGVAFFNIEGGEPFLVYDRLKRICSSIDERSEIWINSTGDGITYERLLELKRMNVTAIMFSLHSPEPDKFNQFMGIESAWDTLNTAISMCHDVGIAVAFNACLMKEDFYNGTFEKVLEAAKDFNACLIQLIKPKPSGGWLGKEGIEFSNNDIDFIKEKVNKYNLQRDFSEYPAISAQIIEEDKDVFGCTAGGVDRFYINAKGDLQPCEFLNISFGNIAVHEFEEIYQKMRNCFEWGGDCFLCEKYTKEIYRLYQENKISSLPLSPELSRKVYDTWDRGQRTDLYERLHGLK